MNWLEIFERQVKPRLRSNDKECWIFTGCIDSMGYGIIQTGSRVDGSRRKAYVHRISYLAYIGEPGGLQVQHECNERTCCNPDHLTLGDHKSNADYMVASGRNKVGSVGQSGLRGVTQQRDGKYHYWIATAGYVENRPVVLYRGKDFFEACCARKSWEAGHR